MVSVIVPTYNRPHLIGDSIESILAQSIQDIEIIVIDGSTNDSTRDTIDNISDPRIRYKRIENRSAASSRNVGLSMAQGEFIAFNDDDDIWLPEKLEHQIKLIDAHLDCPICFCAFEKKRGNRTQIIPDKMETGCALLFSKLLFRNFIGLPTLLIRKQLLEKIHFDEQLTCLEDWDFSLSLARENQIAYLDQVMVHVRDTPNSVNKASHAKKAESYKRIYTKFRSEIEKYPHIEAKHQLSIGSNLCLSGQLLEGRRYLTKAARLSPLSPIVWMALIATYLGERGYRELFKFFEKITSREP